jgi:MacB-like periplasmic core domain
MNWLRQLISRRRRYEELSELIREHIEENVAALMNEGMPREEAERTARRAFGNPVSIEERSREVWQWPTLESTVADLRYALRHLYKSSGFSVVVILSLALGIGATTSMFSLIYAVLLHPVPYADWQRLTYPSYLNDDQPGSPVWWFDLNWPQYQQLLHAGSIEDVVGCTNIQSEITGQDSPEDVTLTYITENVDEFLRVPALLGRNIQRSDAQLTGGQPIVLSFDFWMRHYNGDRDVLNRTLEIDHKPYTILCRSCPRESACPYCPS